jgi:hypothetical protein
MSAYKVKYPWQAYFKDGSTLRQFKPDGSEILFREVLNRVLDVERFHVGPVTVDLRGGSFLLKAGGSCAVKITGSSFVDAFEEWGVDERLPKRLIYFRRVTRQFGGLLPATPYVVYAVGWQATVQGRNVKHIIFIHPDGSLVLA